MSEKYPEITFTLDNLVPGSDGVTVSGVLTVRDRSRPIAFPANVALAGDGGMVLDATVQVDRSDFGMTANKIGMLSMQNTITVHAVFTKN